MKQPRVLFLLLSVIVLALWAAAADAKSQLAVPQAAHAQASGGSVPVYQNLELLHHEGGQVTSLFIQDSYAYLNVGPELQVYDLSDPAYPALVGSVVLDEIIDNLYAYGNYVFAGDNSEFWQTPTEGLRIIDVSNPAAPVQVAFLNAIGLIRDVVVGGDYAYVATDIGVAVISLAGPNPFQWVGFFNQPAESLVYAEEYLYVYSHNTLFVLDVSNPSHPVNAYSQDYGYGRKLTLVDHYLYSISYYGPLLILDVANPTAPEEVATYFYEGIELVAEGNYVFAHIHSKIVILDATNPQMLVEVGSYDLPEGSAFNFSLQVRQGYVYLIRTDYSSDTDSLIIHNATTPSNPFQVNDYLFNETPSIGQLAVAGDSLYLRWEAWYYGNSFDIYDISDPANPVFQGSLATGWDGFSDFVVQDDVAYLATSHCYGSCQSYLDVVDVSNPYTPTIIGSATPEYDYDYSHVELAGRYAYLWGSGLAIFDIANPSEPILIHDAPYQWFDELIASGDKLYTTSFDYLGQGHIKIWDVSTPARPFVITTYGLPRQMTLVGLISTYAYLIDSWGMLYVLDVSDPQHIHYVDAYRPPWYPGGDYAYFQMDVAGRYAYATYHNKVVVLDVADPAHPYEVAFHHVAGREADIAVKGNFFYVSANIAGWYVLEQTPVMVWLTPDLAGSLTYTDYRRLPLRFDFPAGSVSEPVTVAVGPAEAQSTTDAYFAQHAFALAALQGEKPLPSFEFTAPITVTLRYKQNEVGVITNEAELALWVWRENGWQDATTTCHNPTPYLRDVINNVLTLTICQTGRFALFGPTHQHYIPVADPH